MERWAKARGKAKERPGRTGAVIKDLDDQEFQDVLQWKTGLGCLYFYNPRERVVRRLDPSEVCWPVVVVLAFYNKKHRFVLRTSPRFPQPSTTSLTRYGRLCIFAMIPIPAAESTGTQATTSQRTWTRRLGGKKFVHLLKSGCGG